MSWYRAGSVTVTNGSNIVTGAGTDFVSNASVGEAFIGPDGRSYEIGQIVSATDLRLTTTYQAATGGGQAYAIQPTQSFARDLALAAAALLNTFAAVRDGVGQGLFPAGTVAAPGIRGVLDQDTGLRWLGDNAVAVGCGGVDKLTVQASGNILLDGPRTIVANGVGTAMLANPADAGAVAITAGSTAGYITSWTANGGGGSAPNTLVAITGSAERARFDASGNFLVGTTSGSNHLIAKSVAEGNAILQIVASASGTRAAQFNGTAQEGFNGARAALWLGKDSTTGRSGGFAGTVNASGADYAEYMLKSAGCGVIAKGDVCGVDRDGKLTKTWADAVSFVVKSTDPSLVGGDTWAAHMPPRPEAPGAEPRPPALPSVPDEGADDDEVAAYQDALAAYPVRVAQHRVDHEAWAAATAAYERDLSVWEAELEAARVCVDRIAFCGQVPCNVSGDFEVGDYIVAAASGAGIKAVAVKPDDITLPQYMRRIGKVWAIRDGRAWIDVQHG